MTIIAPFAKVAETYTSGETLLEKIRTNTVDILIVDSALTGVSGLSIAKAVFEEDIKTQIILLCKHCDFALARTALKYGISQLATTPVDKEEILGCLEETKSCFEIEKDEILNKDVTEQHFRDLSRQSLFMFVNSNVPISELLNNNHFKHIGLRENNFTIVDFSAQRTRGEDTTITYSTMWRDMCEVKNDDIDVFCISENVDTARFFVIVKSRIEEKAKNVVTDFAESTVKLMRSAYGFYVYYEITGLENLCTEKVYDFKELSTSFINAMLSNNKEKLSELNGIVESFDSADNTKKLLLGIVSKLENSLIIDGTSIKNSINRLTKEQMVSELKRLEDDVIKSTLNQSELVTTVKKCVANLADADFSLKSISDSVAYTPYYLSRIYKNETGESLSNYLFKCRINKAKELLLTKQYNVLTVAKMVGFENASYFSRAFKKETGMLPKQFSLKEN